MSRRTRSSAGATALDLFNEINRTIANGAMQAKSAKFQLTDVHVRGARALLKWSATELAEKSGLAPSTIVSWENGRHRPTPETRAKVREVLEDAGVIFLNHGSPGVRLRAKD